jgi:hypothetical protein
LAAHACNAVLLCDSAALNCSLLCSLLFAYSSRTRSNPSPSSRYILGLEPLRSGNLYREFWRHVLPQALTRGLEELKKWLITPTTYESVPTQAVPTHHVLPRSAIATAQASRFATAESVKRGLESVPEGRTKRQRIAQEERRRIEKSREPWAPRPTLNNLGTHCKTLADFYKCWKMCRDLEAKWGNIGELMSLWKATMDSCCKKVMEGRLGGGNDSQCSCTSKSIASPTALRHRS